MIPGPHRRYNPLLDEWVLCSPHRLERPWQGQMETVAEELLPRYDPTCYLCPGNLRANGQRNPAYEATFAFDNDFPALLPEAPGGHGGADRRLDEGGLLVAEPAHGRCRVICFSPRHDLTLAQMDTASIREVVEAWADEVEALGAEERIRYVQLFENKGALMGCSNPHPHCQAWATGHIPFVPSRKLRSQRAYFEAHGRDLLGDYLEKERAEGERLVAWNDHWVALVPFWAVWPFETMLVPTRRVPDLPSLRPEERDALADLLHRLTVRYDNLFHCSFPYSLGWHGRPTDGGDHPWWRLHATAFPPLLRSATVRKFLVGFELTAEPQRDLTAEAAAARLRELPDEHYPEIGMTGAPASDRDGIDPSLIGRVEARFAELFGGPPKHLAVAPGRVNLIGEHTDYNDGFVLPMAIGRATAIAFRPRSDRRLKAHAVAFRETKEVDLEHLAPPGGSDWIAYVAGVAWALRGDGFDPPGIDAVIDGDVPIGAGLSSSASLELCAARAFAAAGGIPWDPVAMAKLGQKAENLYVGMNCGLMDQFASAVSRKGCALLLDCRSLETEPVPVPAGAAVVVMDTGARRALAGSAYNDRRAACEAAVLALRDLAPGIRALRDVSAELLEQGKDRLDPVVLKRARHVVPENLRPREMAAALRGGDLAQAGRLMNDSHASLRDLYEVSCAELDLITDLARAQPGCHGARMTGAGFGGCAVALVAEATVASFCESVLSAYRAKVELPAALFACRPMAGARVLD